MPKRRTSMRVLKDVLRLSMESKLSARAVARFLQLAHSTVNDYFRRARKASLTWPLPEGMTDGELKALLYKRPTRDVPVRPQADWPAIDLELKRKGVTLLLREEYQQQHPDGYGYSRYCVCVR